MESNGKMELRMVGFGWRVDAWKLWRQCVQARFGTSVKRFFRSGYRVDPSGGRSKSDLVERQCGR